jgi:hypothetical protein
MPSSAEVVPGDWRTPTLPIVLFDNGEYSVISGYYQGNSTLGERWNGCDGNIGFPNQAGHPLWHVVPHFLHVPLLHGLLDELARQPQQQTPEGAMSPVETAVVRRGRIREWVATGVPAGVP